MRRSRVLGVSLAIAALAPLQAVALAHVPRSPTLCFRAEPRPVARWDVNGDGVADRVYVVRSANSASVEAFTNERREPGPENPAGTYDARDWTAADLDNDSDLDIAVVGGYRSTARREVAGRANILLNDGRGRFTRGARSQLAGGQTG